MRRLLTVLFANCSASAPVETTIAVPSNVPMYRVFNEMIGARFGDVRSVEMPGVVADVWFDDEGRLTDRPKQVNRIATLLAGVEIIGDAIVVGFEPETGESRDLSRDEIERLVRGTEDVE